MGCSFELERGGRSIKLTPPSTHRDSSRYRSLASKNSRRRLNYNGSATCGETPIAGRLLLIALDSCPPSLIEEGSSDGSLPNFRRLLDEGTWGAVRSDARMFPGSIWPTFFTRTDVSHHGIYHSLQWDPATRTLRTPGPDWFEVPAFWDSVAAAGSPVITLDVPFAAGATRAGAVTEVLGWGTHEALWATSRPRRLLADLNRKHGRSSVLPEISGPREDAVLARNLEALIEDVGRRTAIILDLAARFEWRLMIACYTETHHAGHWFWGSRVTGEPQGGLRRVLRAIDSAIPALRGRLTPEDSFAVFSPHSMGPRFHGDRFSDTLREYLDPAGQRHHWSRDAPVRAMRSLVPPGVMQAIARALPKTWYRRLLRLNEIAARNWASSVAIINPLDDLLYVSLNSPADKNAELTRLTGEFEALRTPGGSKAVASLLRPAAVYGGSRLGLLPDLVARLAPIPLEEVLVTAAGNALRGRQRTWQDGDHVPDGFYLQVGPAVPPCAQGPDVMLQDLASHLCAPARINVP